MGHDRPAGLHGGSTRTLSNIGMETAVGVRFRDLEITAGLGKRGSAIYFFVKWSCRAFRGFGVGRIPRVTDWNYLQYDLTDGVLKYICIFIRRCKFSMPPFPGGRISWGEHRISIAFEIHNASTLTPLKPLTITLTPPQKINSNSNPA